VLELVISWAVTTTLLFLIVLTDEKRMSEERLEEAWPPATRTLVLVWLGILALPFHFARTRGRLFTTNPRRFVGWWIGLGLGLVASVLVALIDTAVVTAFAWAVGLPIDD